MTKEGLKKQIANSEAGSQITYDWVADKMQKYGLTSYKLSQCTLLSPSVLSIAKKGGKLSTNTKLNIYRFFQNLEHEKE